MPDSTDPEIIDEVVKKRFKKLNGPQGSITKRAVLTLVATLRDHHDDATTIEGVVDALERLCEEAKSISRELVEARLQGDDP